MYRAELRDCVQSSVTESWLFSDMSDARQKALEHITPFIHLLNLMPAWYHILVGEESQEDHGVPRVTRRSQSDTPNCSEGLASGR